MAALAKYEETIGLIENLLKKHEIFIVE